MKKQFIQKLSIAMAAALTITSLSQAPVSAAAKDMKMDKATKTLYLNEDNSTNTGKSYDFSIKNKPSDYKTKYKFTWYADDTSIVSVKAGGVVTAKKVGKTTVSCKITNKSGKTVATAKAEVTVKANAETVKINNAVETMAPGESYDFNRTMKNFKGGKATDKTEWLVTADEAGTEKTDIATVDKNGVVTVAKAGVFYLTARTYQSAATKDITTATDTIKVTSVASVTEVSNSAYNVIKLTINDDMSAKLTEKNVKVTNANGIDVVVKAVAFEEGGKVANVTVYNPLADKAVYKVKAGDLEAVEFTASVGAVDSIEIAGPVKAAIGVATKINYVLKDANGVVLDATGKKVTFEAVDAATATCYFDNNDIVCYELNKSNTIVAVYATGTYNADGTEVKVKSQPFTVNCVDNVDPSLAGTPVFTLTSEADDSKANFTAVNATVAKGDSTKHIAVKYMLDGNKDAQYSTGSSDKWTFESTNSNIAIVDAATGRVLPVVEGDVNVIVKYDNTIVGTFAITVGAEAKAASISVDKPAVTLTNSASINESVDVKVTLKDQYQNDFVGTAVDVAELFTETNAAKKPVYTVTGTDTVTFSAVGVPAGQYRYKLTRSERVTFVTVTVKAPDATTTRVQVTANKNAVDMKVASDADVTSKSITLDVRELDKYNVAKGFVTGVVYEVKDANGKLVDEKFLTRGGDKLVVNPIYVDGSKYIQKMPAGTYTVSATVSGSDKVNGLLIVKTQFTLTDTQATTAVIVDQVSKTLDAATDKAGMAVALKDCFKLASGNTNFVISEIDSTATTFESGKTYGVVVKKIVVTESIGTYFMNTEYAVNKVIQVTIK